MISTGTVATSSRAASTRSGVRVNAVNADRQLRQLAKKRGWRQYDFRKLRLARKFGLPVLLTSILGFGVGRKRFK